MNLNVEMSAMNTTSTGTGTTSTRCTSGATPSDWDFRAENNANLLRLVGRNPTGATADACTRRLKDVDHGACVAQSSPLTSTTVSTTATPTSTVKTSKKKSVDHETPSKKYLSNPKPIDTPKSKQASKTAITRRTEATSKPNPRPATTCTATNTTSTNANTTNTTTNTGTTTSRSSKPYNPTTAIRRAKSARHSLATSQEFNTSSTALDITTSTRSTSTSARSNTYRNQDTSKNSRDTGGDRPIQAPQTTFKKTSHTMTITTEEVNAYKNSAKQTKTAPSTSTKASYPSNKHEHKHKHYKSLVVDTASATVTTAEGTSKDGTHTEKKTKTDDPLEITPEEVDAYKRCAFEEDGDEGDQPQAQPQDRLRSPSNKRNELPFREIVVVHKTTPVANTKPKNRVSPQQQQHQYQPRTSSERQLQMDIPLNQTLSKRMSFRNNQANSSSSGKQLQQAQVHQRAMELGIHAPATPPRNKQGKRNSHSTKGNQQPRRSRSTGGNNNNNNSQEIVYTSSRELREGTDIQNLVASAAHRGEEVQVVHLSSVSGGAGGTCSRSRRSNGQRASQGYVDSAGFVNKEHGVDFVIEENDDDDEESHGRRSAKKKSGIVGAVKRMFKSSKKRSSGATSVASSSRGGSSHHRRAFIIEFDEFGAAASCTPHDLSDRQQHLDNQSSRSEKQSKQGRRRRRKPSRHKSIQSSGSWW
ncbi:expressed unknown protein [Seminavis robusta]|uniref:Uncharacterized protein n=1 Tax=Seminavis robusta TaxID=568900 RepID=A0A9N8EKF2_9STRA|nr:expressed unknown protein [Seminavis robusta]|eukprot:Sro1129_g244350.1 n/a (699) ;mRNA; r:10654-12750